MAVHLLVVYMANVQVISGSSIIIVNLFIQIKIVSKSNKTRRFSVVEIGPAAAVQ